MTWTIWQVSISKKYKVEQGGGYGKDVLTRRHLVKLLSQSRQLGLSTGGGVTWGAATGSATGLGLARGVATVRAARARVRMEVANFMVLNLMK
jgi:hypothetical protein